jgi:adiponectin receptor
MAFAPRTHAPNNRKRPYIVSGYATGTRSQRIFSVHNETLNIWTHIMGGVLFVLQLAGAVHVRNVVLAGYTATAVCMFVCSAHYHAVSTHEPAKHARALGADFFGIGLFIATSQAAGVHYAFGCDAEARTVYLLVTAVLFGISARVSLLHGWARRWRWLALSAVLGGVPVVHHMLALHSGAQQSMRAAQEAFVRAVGYYAVGIVFFVTGAPERFAPGVFDIVGQSHQFWHLLVLCGALEYLDALRLAAAHAEARTCA